MKTIRRLYQELYLVHKLTSQEGVTMEEGSPQVDSNTYMFKLSFGEKYVVLLNLYNYLFLVGLKFLTCGWKTI